MTRTEFIESNLGLVHACARRFKGRGIEYEDLFQAGCMGLIKACDGFDESRGLMFSTYAVPVILGEVKKLFRESGTVKVSRRLKELSLKAVRLRDKLTALNGDEPSVGELAGLMECPRELLIEALCAARPALSLTIEDDDEQTQRELQLPAASPEARITERISLSDAVQALDEKEKQLIELRFIRCMTQAAAAKLLGTTQVQVSRNERRIVEKLRRNML